MNVSRFSRPVVRQISAEIADAVQEIATKYNIKIEKAGGSFTNASSTFKLKATLLAPAPGVKTREESSYEVMCNIEGLPPINSIFTSRGSDYKIIGWNTRARKYPINAIKVSTGQAYKFPINVVKNAVVKYTPVVSDEEVYAEQHADDPDA